MKVKEYLSKLGIGEHSSISLTFVIAEERGKDYVFRYRGTPIRVVWEWYESANREDSILNYNILNIEQPFVSWMSGADWNDNIKCHRLMSLLVISDDVLRKSFSEEQGQHTLAYIDKQINITIEDGTNPFLMK